MFDPVSLYKKKVFSQFEKEFIKKGKLLDVGCGDGSDAKIFTSMGLEVFGIDVYEHKNIKGILGKRFKKASIYKLPFPDHSFDYVFEHDTLHHIDEEKQSFGQHVAGLEEMKRVCKKGGKIIVLEANRYNPLFYPHMVKMRKHEHFTQPYFVRLLETIAKKPKFVFFEAHVYPQNLLLPFTIYEKIMKSIPFLYPFRAYNLAIFENE